MTTHEYKHREYITAEKVEEAGIHHLNSGASYVKQGDYLVYGKHGVFVLDGTQFEKEFVLVEEEESEVRQFSPAGQTVDAVLNFLRDNPDEIKRVKAEELAGAKRKGILEYEK